MTKKNTGTLYLVATPIGNLADMSPRAVEILQGVGLVLAEDTRVFARLAQRFAIHTSVESYHEHNERQKTKQVIARLQEGVDIALTSDAGTPLVSDPGYHLINAAHQNGITVSSIPGPCAAIAALALSGFEPHRFRFEGFLPPKKGRRAEAIAEAIEGGVTTIFYESPHRIVKTLAEICAQAPELEVCVARELSKLHEECTRGAAAEVHRLFAERSSIKGEIVLLLRCAQKHRSDVNQQH